MATESFKTLKVDHKTVLVRDMTVFRHLRDFLVNNGYQSVYEVERIGEEKTAMATFACRHRLHGECLAVVHGISGTDEVSHAQAPFAFGFHGTPANTATTYIQHLALRTTDLFKLREYLQKRGAGFLTPIYQDKDSFGPLLQSFTRELFEDEWFFIEFVQRDYDAERVRAKTGDVQFANKTVQSLYMAKQEEFREWMRTKRKRKFLDGLSPTEARKVLKEIVDNIEPKGYASLVPPLARSLA